MKRLEHSDVIEACKTAVQKLADEHGSFSKADVVKAVLAVHPELDIARVRRAATKCLEALDRHPTVEQGEADLQEIMRHADALIAQGRGAEAEDYTKRKLAELERALESRAWELYSMQIETRVLGRQGDRTIHDMVKRIGGDAYIEAIKAELRLDGQPPDTVSTSKFGSTVLTSTTEQFLHWFRVEARRILNDEKPKIEFHFHGEEAS